MRRSFSHRFAKNESAAIAPMYALGIGTLIVMSAVGFDYGRLMALDTELQNAADQAALAAATQLDGGADAMTRARDAATSRFANAASQFVNQTRFANDGAGRPITNLTFEFFDGYANDTLGDTVALNATDGADAKVVQVTVNARRVFYALTPLVGAFTSGDVIGRALAGLETATCNVPPMMFCLPEVAGVADTGYPRDSDIGNGVALHFKSNGPDSPGNPNDETTDDGSTWAPGNFGFLDLDYFTGNQNRTTGLNSDVLGCTGTPPISDPGFRTPQGSALNSRFDLYPPPVNNCDSSTGDFCPAQNVRKNLVYQMQGNGSDCNPPNNFQQNRWVDPVSVGLADPGYPKDTIQAANPSLAYGDGDWGAATWFGLKHPSSTFTDADLNSDGRVTRYEIYQWELDPAYPSRLDSGSRMTGTDGNGYCAFNRPADEPPGVPVSSTQKDRRILTVAAVDCTDLNGKEQVKITSWVDMFLVQPVKSSGSDRDFYSEIAGPARRANGDSGFQYFGRKKAVLIR